MAPSAASRRFTPGKARTRTRMAHAPEYAEAAEAADQTSGSGRGTLVFPGARQQLDLSPFSPPSRKRGQVQFPKGGQVGLRTRGSDGAVGCGGRSKRVLGC